MVYALVGLWPSNTSYGSSRLYAAQQEAMLIRGDQLNLRQREQVLAAFIYRWTTGNTRRAEAYGTCPVCKVPGGKPAQNRKSSRPGAVAASWRRSLGCRQHHPVIRLQTDDEWLREHAFHFVRDGSRLMVNRRHAEPEYLAPRHRKE